MSNENWKPVVGFETLFEVSDMGRVRSLPSLDSIGRVKHGKVMTNARVSGRYVRIRFRHLGVFNERCVHHLVLEAFVGPRPSPEIHGCHNDGDCLNNVLTNLRWDTASANQLDKIRHGTMARGERNGWASLTDEQAAAAKRLLLDGVGPTEVAKRFGISRKHAQRIKSGEAWAWL